MTVRLILASSSPFRRMLMQNAGVSFDVHPAEIDERAVEAPLEADGATPDAVALVLAKAKAREVSGRFPDALVLGSDQTMSLGKRTFHKPRNMNDAADHLKALRGATHRLNSAIALALGGDIIWEHISHAELTMRMFSDDFIQRHLCRVGDRALASVGAYQLEGEGLQLFTKIEGDYFTILGLPMMPLLEKLRELGAIDG
ncbi:Maf-like protein [Rhizobium sp. S96]|uniref:Maf-like protein n=1 Tax=Rhizobium sp. S96 TaxID=3055140 RepID=UPI0025AB48E5|nr:Maf-like protein [Rhizobium sp. S96]MDM9621181.1 Maf-like protein [Rhizobium sp. S96]